MGNVGKWIRNILLGLVILAFVVIFGQPGSGGGPLGAVAEVGGETISRDIFEFFREINERNLPPEASQTLDVSQRNQILDERTRGGLIQRYILAQEARSLGLSVPDEALRADLQRNPAFQRNGRYDRDAAETFVARTGLGMREYMAQHRRDLLVREFTRLVQSSVRVSDVAAREEIQRARTTVKLKYATADPSQFAQKVDISDEAAAALLAAEPERVRALYESRKQEFQRVEQIRARHILLTGDDAEARAISARARLEGGEDFAAVAKELSQDPATRDQGGDLGFFPRGRMLEAFDRVAFELEPGKVSGPVQTERGVHLIRVEEKQTAESRSFEDVSKQLARGILASEKAAELARTSIARLIARVGTGEDLVKVAVDEGLPAEVTPPFQLGARQISGLMGVEGAAQAAASLTEQKPLYPRPLRRGDSWVAVTLMERSEPDSETVDGMVDMTRQQLEKRRRDITRALWLNERQRQLERDGEIQLFPFSAQN